MSVSRRTAVKLGLAAGAAPLLSGLPLEAARAWPRAARAAADGRVQARAIPLDDVRLTGGPLRHAQDLDRNYLLALEPDRMLAYYRERAGLPPRARPYDGWDGGGRNLTGHIAGHYLSAVSLMWAATGDRRFKDRADYLVAELKAVQDTHGDGYLCALEHGRRCFGELARGEIRAAAFDLNGEWSPWYTVHKLFAGLRDAYRHTGNGTALAVEVKLAGWAEGVLSGLDDAQLQHMMDTEFGGMNEVLVGLAADTGDTRWLRLSYAFEHRAFVQPLQRGQDDLGGKHVNCAVPKLIGSAQRFIDVGRPEDLMAASFFWNRVADHHSFASGGSGTDEYWGPADVLGARIDGRTDESCPVYNMLKLSRMLFAVWPDAHAADFHERMLFNHALGSIDPADGRMCYMVPIGQGVTHEYQDMFHDFTCCVGTGMENHALHGLGVWFESGNTVWLNQYVPCTAEWREARAQLTLETDFPEGDTATLTLRLQAPRAFALAVRRPYWVGEGFAVTVNGAPVAPLPSRQDPYDFPAPVGGYVEVRRTWHSGDVVRVALPKTLRLEATPDTPRRAAIMWGPLLLAGDIGPEPEQRAGSQTPPAPVVPVLVAADQPVDRWLEPVVGAPGEFHTRGVGREPDAEGRARDVRLVPFYRLHERTYTAYWDLFTPEEWAARKLEYAREAERARALDAATVAFVQPGNRDTESPFNYQAGDGVHAVFIEHRLGRAGRSWFSYDLPVDPAHPMAVVATYYSADRRTLPADFAVLVDGQQVGTQHLDRSDPGRFLDLTYPVPAELVRGKAKVTVRFEAQDGSRLPAIFGVRTVRSDQLGS